MHTTSSWHTCPCVECREKLRAYHRKYSAERRRNPGPRLTDAAPVAAHINAMRAAGMGYPDIEAISGYNRETLRDTAKGRVIRVRTVMAEDLLSIPVEVAA